jgi:transcription antitermination factor NusG
VTGTPDPAWNEARWYALKTRARSERKAGERLEGSGVEVFLAAPRLERVWSDRVKRVAMPLFPGYIFGRFPLAHLYRVLEVPGVVDVVRIAGVAVPVRTQEMASVRLLVEGVDATGALPKTVDPLEPGDPVRVVDGPFKGMTGVLLRGRGPAWVSVKIEALRQARAVQLERDAVAPLRTRGGGAW